MKKKPMTSAATEFGSGAQWCQDLNPYMAFFSFSFLFFWWLGGAGRELSCLGSQYGCLCSVHPTCVQVKKKGGRKVTVYVSLFGQKNPKAIPEFSLPHLNHSPSQKCWWSPQFRKPAVRSRWVLFVCFSQADYLHTARHFFPPELKVKTRSHLTTASPGLGAPPLCLAQAPWRSGVQSTFGIWNRNVRKPWVTRGPVIHCVNSSQTCPQDPDFYQSPLPSGHSFHSHCPHGILAPHTHTSAQATSKPRLNSPHWLLPFLRSPCKQL